MSFQAMAWAVEQKCKCPGQKLALLMLANHSNGHTGQCNPSHKRLAEECSMGVSTLKNHLRDLQQAGYLTIIHKSADGVSLPNQYRLNIDGVSQNLTGGGSKSGRGVGQNLATNQEVEPGIEPFTNTDVLVGISAADAALFGRRKNDCPHKEIIALYHEILPMCPQVRDWTPARATQLRARWNEDEKRQSLNYWKRFFEYIRGCDFLVGKGSGKPFFADLEWITKSANFTKIREAKYENRGQA
jgi:hypothetical protein